MGGGFGWGFAWPLGPMSLAAIATFLTVFGFESGKSTSTFAIWIKRAKGTTAKQRPWEPPTNMEPGRRVEGNKFVP